MKRWSGSRSWTFLRDLARERNVSWHEQSRKILIILCPTFVAIDIARVWSLPQSCQTAFTNAFELVVVSLGVVTCVFAAVRSSELARAMWVLVAAYLALNAVADLQDLLVDIHFSRASLLATLGFSGWCVYLPLALLIFFLRLMAGGSGGSGFPRLISFRFHWR